MTTNQTIDGVPRELLERLLTDACNENWSDLNELLHSASACRCRRYGKGNPHWPCPVHPVAAPVVERQPVAWLDEESGALATDKLKPLLEGFDIPLFASPPAPVAVVLPEREMYCKYLRGVIPDNRLEVEAHKDGWNACLDELKRLNPSL